MTTRLEITGTRAAFMAALERQERQILERKTREQAQQQANQSPKAA